VNSTVGEGVIPTEPSISPGRAGKLRAGRRRPGGPIASPCIRPSWLPTRFGSLACSRPQAIPAP